MFNQISWSTYLMVILTLSVIYYSLIGYLYFRSDILKLFAGKLIIKKDKVLTNRNEIVQSFTHDLHEFVDHASQYNLDKKVLMSSMRLLINKYPEIKDPAIQHSVMEFMIRECVSSIHLSEEELRELWN
ncbi:MAG: hypothetical protein ACTHK8_01000 [Ginsengibacter sp.]|nr:hypothetical protein [Hanamia sp.]